MADMVSAEDTEVKDKVKQEPGKSEAEKTIHTESGSGNITATRHENDTETKQTFVKENVVQVTGKPGDIHNTQQGPSDQDLKKSVLKLDDKTVQSKKVACVEKDTDGERILGTLGNDRYSPRSELNGFTHLKSIEEVPETNNNEEHLKLTTKDAPLNPAHEKQSRRVKTKSSKVSMTSFTSIHIKKLSEFDKPPGKPWYTISDIQKAERLKRYMINLGVLEKTDVDQKEVYLAMVDLCVLCDEEMFLRYAGQSNVGVHLHRIMSSCLQVSHIQQIGCLMLIKFMERGNLAFRSSLIKQGFCDLMVKVIREHTLDADVQAQAFQTVALLEREKNSSCQKTLVLDCQLIDSIIIALSAYQDRVDVQAAACQVLHILLADVSQTSASVQLELVTSVTMEMMKNHIKCVDVMFEALCLLKVLMDVGDLVQIESSEDLPLLIHRCMQHHQDHSGVLLVCLQVLNKICTAEKPVMSLHGCKMMDILLTVMERFIENNAQLQVEGFWLLQNMLINITNKYTIEGKPWVRHIYTCMKMYLNDCKLQEVCCIITSLLLQYDSHLNNVIGEDLFQEALHTQVFGVLLVYGGQQEVFSTACEALYWIICGNSDIQTVFGQRNLHLAVFEALKSYKQYPKALVWGCRLLRGLCIFNQDNKERVAHDSKLKQVLWALRNYSGDSALQFEAIGLIACLHDTEAGSGHFPRTSVIVPILTAMEKHEGSSGVLEMAVEALCALLDPGGSKQSSDVNMVDVVDRTLNAMKTFTSNIALQRKGLTLLQVTAHQVGLQDQLPLCQEIASVVTATMRQNMDDLVLLTEGCVTVQVLSDDSELMASSFVDKMVHVILLEIINTFDDHEGIVDLACQCLHYLAVVKDFKSAMLCSLAQKGCMQGVELMVELGADVNYGKGSDTPTSHACSRNDKSMVKYLLAQGVRDLQTALSLSLHQKHHSIVGLLLKEYDMDKDAGLLSWSGLNLTDLLPEWIAPTFTETEHIKRTTSEMGMRLYKRVLRSVDQRSKRRGMTMDTTSLKQDEKRPLLRHQFGYANRKYKQDNVTVSQARQTAPAPVSPDKSGLREYSPKELDDMQDYQGYDMWPEEFKQWTKSTLTSSNVPYSPKDPRCETAYGQHLSFSCPISVWERKTFGVERRVRPRQIPVPSSACQAAMMSTSPAGTEDIVCNTDTSTTDGSGLPGELQVMVKKGASLPWNTSGTEASGFVTYSGMPTILDEESLTDPEGWSLKGSVSVSPDDEVDDKKRSRFRRSASCVDLPSRDSGDIGIRQFDLSNNQISNFLQLVTSGARLLKYFHHIVEMDCSHNQIESIPDVLFQHLPKIRDLNLSSNRLMRFPSPAFRCQHLHRLDLSFNQLVKVLPDQRCDSLVDLNLAANVLEDFPAFYKAAPNLTSLDMSHNKLQQLPDSPLNLPALVSLNLNHNYLSEIPEQFLLQCKKLVTLSVQNNELEKLPSEHIAPHLPKLSNLRLSYNQLVEKPPFFIPKLVLKLESIRLVDLAHNNLAGLPQPHLWESRSLKQLVISHNMLTKLDLGHHAKDWSTLVRLSISHNNLSQIPKEIGQLSSLTSLDVSHNPQVTTLPDELGRCTKLWELCLDGLKLDLDGGLLNGKTRDLIGYLHEKLKKAVEYNHMKMMLVGYGGRGKSTLLRQLRKEKHPEKSVATVGIVVKQWRLGESRMFINRDFTLSAWDFAGQEDFYSTHQCFLSKRALYVVVYNLSKGETEVDFIQPWLQNIQARAPGCPVIVVGTHVDKIPKDIRNRFIHNMREKIIEMAQKIGFTDPLNLPFAELDCSRENSGVEKLRNLIREVLTSFKVKGKPIIGQKVPASYVKLQELLTAEGRSLRNSLPVIKHSRLKKIVKDSCLDLDEEELHQAVRFLHESGVLLHYDDVTLKLNDLYFVDPEWLCRMMAQVVTVREINPFINNQGVLKKSDVRMLFTGKRVNFREEMAYSFPPHLIPHYLRLLEKFEIALPLTDDEYVIPCRLPTTRPSFIVPGEDTLCVHRQYQMQYTPIGLWSRLLCRLLTFADVMTKEFGLAAREVQERTVWREGIYVQYSPKVFFLVESVHIEKEILDITTPSGRLGVRLLGLLVDHVDTLLEEWYPGLLEVDPCGNAAVQILVPCVLCQGQDEEDPTTFSFEELLSAVALEEESVTCLKHLDKVPIRTMAPDIMFEDIEPQYRLSADDVALVKSPEHLLGEGAFGAVYKARYKNHHVAVKIFSSVGDVHPYKLMRQELSILRRLSHPSLISLVGVGIHPHIVVLELAPMGTLHTIIRGDRDLAKVMLHRLALQIAEGLLYLHQKFIVYRDMKPENILIFSLSQSVVVNAKISDYGVSRYSGPSGLTAAEGTPGYRAPEVVKGEPYGTQADVYSLGITLYQMVTRGRHPLSELSFRSELDEAVVKGLPIDPVYSKHLTTWHDMQELIDHCIKQTPEARPSAEMVYNRLNTAEFLGLKTLVSLSKDYDVDSLAIRTFGENQREAWIASSNWDSVLLSVVSLSPDKDPSRAKGTVIQDKNVLCMAVAGQNHMLLGTSSGKIWVYNAVQRKPKHCLNMLSDSILCLCVSNRLKGNGYIFAGLANGTLAIYNTEDVLNHPNCEPHYEELGTRGHSPIRAMAMCSSPTLYVACGSTVNILKLEPSIFVEKKMETASECEGLITFMEAYQKLIYLSKRNSSVIEVWHNTRLKHKYSINMKVILSSHFNFNSSSEARITCMCLQKSVALWVGTASGHVTLMDVSQQQPITVVHRHIGAVRCMGILKTMNYIQQSLAVVTVGVGFVSCPGVTRETDKNHGYMAVWSYDLAQQVRASADYQKKRQELIENKSRELKSSHHVD